MKIYISPDYLRKMICRSSSNFKSIAIINVSKIFKLSTLY